MFREIKTYEKNLYKKASSAASPDFDPDAKVKKAPANKEATITQEVYDPDAKVAKRC